MRFVFLPATISKVYERSRSGAPPSSSDERRGGDVTMARVFLTHIPDMLRNYYGDRAVAALRSHAEVAINPTGQVLDADALAVQARGCEIIVSDRQTPGPAEVFRKSPDLVAFLRCAVDIRNIDVP